MLNNNQRAKQAKGQKIEPDFDSILEQILNFDTQKKASEARSMKSASKPREKKRSSAEPFSLCLYCSKPGHPQEKCYYKHPKRASKDFRQKFQNCIKELQSKANATKAQINNLDEEENEVNRIYVVQNKSAVLATGQHDPNWYFDNAASYHMIYNLGNFNNPDSMIKCRHPQDNITLADGLVILPDGIGTVSLAFSVKGRTENIFRSRVCYCSKLDTKLISLEMLDQKSLTYSS